MERRILPHRPQRNAGILVNVPLSDLYETAERCETGKPHRDRFGGECVQYHIHALAVGELHDLFGKVCTTRVNDMLNSEGFEQRALGRTAGTGRTKLEMRSAA